MGPHSISRDFLDITFLPAGVAADQRVVFVGDPLEGRVIAFSRLTGKQIGELPQPPGGFVVPFIMHSLGEGRVGVLDAGGLPQPKPLVPAHPLLSEYTYTFDPVAGFSATLARFVDSTGTLVGFPEDFVKLPDGRILLSDAVLGSIWVIQPDGTYTPGIVPKTFDPGDAIPQMAICPTMPEVTVNGVPFLFSGSTIPGIEAIAVRGGWVYFHSSCARGLFKFPLAILSDGRAPYQRAADLQLIASTPADIQVEELLDMQFNPYDPDRPVPLYRPRDAARGAPGRFAERRAAGDRERCAALRLPVVAGLLAARDRRYRDRLSEAPRGVKPAGAHADHQRRGQRRQLQRALPGGEGPRDTLTVPTPIRAVEVGAQDGAPGLSPMSL